MIEKSEHWISYTKKLLLIIFQYDNSYMVLFFLSRVKLLKKLNAKKLVYRKGTLKINAAQWSGLPGTEV